MSLERSSDSHEGLLGRVILTDDELSTFEEAWEASTSGNKLSVEIRPVCVWSAPNPKAVR